MSKSEATKQKHLQAIMAFVLKHGIADASLRPLAKAAGTSDRMLIYHFGSKDGRITELLIALASEFTENLDQALPEVRMTSQRALLNSVLAVVRDPKVKPYIRLWQEVTTMASLGNPASIATGRDIVQGFVDWLARRMPEDVSSPEAAAQAMLTVIEGVHVMDAVGQETVASAAVDVLYPKP